MTWYPGFIQRHCASAVWLMRATPFSSRTVKRRLGRGRPLGRASFGCFRRDRVRPPADHDKETTFATASDDFAGLR